jgi:3',5'-cyclic AMP phosphodiesterase CpdA
VTVAQFTDTHVVREGSSYFGIDTVAYLREAIRAVNALDPQPEFAVVTGDLVNFGTAAEYGRFRDTMSELHAPYFVIPGNHDDRERMRAVLPPQTYGGSREGKVHYSIGDFSVGLVGLDGNSPRPWPGAIVDASSFEWLERTLIATRNKPTILSVHQPPFRTGLHYLDFGGFVPRRRLRALVDAHPHVTRVISGHIHCVRTSRWSGALAITAPSTSPQVIPLLFSAGRLFGIRRERPGFSIHEVSADGTATTAVYRRDDAGNYAVDAVYGPDPASLTSRHFDAAGVSESGAALRRGG